MDDLPTMLLHLDRRNMHQITHLLNNGLFWLMCNFILNRSLSYKVVFDGLACLLGALFVTDLHVCFNWQVTLVKILPGLLSRYFSTGDLWVVPGKLSG